MWDQILGPEILGAGISGLLELTRVQVPRVRNYPCEGVGMGFGVRILGLGFGDWGFRVWVQGFAVRGSGSREGLGGVGFEV